MKSDRANLSTILERIERVRRFTKEGKADFLRSELIQDAVIRELEVIGEATKRLGVVCQDIWPVDLSGDVAALRSS
ncbi:MAG TPA: HepT-like ribonuclease domain-containing protein [Thermoplasmata archaeon]|nr:HepT-like ribonuclease domain-containing protein [Thermoplasmata archaeon]